MLREWRDSLPSIATVRLRLVAMVTVLTTLIAGLVLTDVAEAAQTKPTLSSATTTSTSVSITVAADATATSYTYQVTSPTAGTLTSVGTTMPIVVSGLSSNTTYIIAVKAIGSGGTSPALSVTATTLPVAPTGLSVSSTTGASVTVGFTVTGDATSNVQYSTDGGTNWVTPGTAVTASPITITGLSANSSYSIALKIVNASGTSSASSTVAAVTGPAAPTAATASVVNGDSTKLTLAFTAPSFGSYSLTRYEYSIDSGATWVTAAQSTSPITVTGLSANTGYAVQLRAVSSGGTGSAVTLASVTTPLAAPTALSVSVAATASTVSIAFTKPAGTVTTYEYSLDDGATWATRPTGTTASPVALTGLSANTTYQFRLRAVSTAGSGSPSAALAFTTTTPGAPTSITASGVTGDGTKLSVSFTPASGNAAVTQYDYTSNAGTSSAAATGTTSPIQIPGLTANTAYTGYQIRVITAGGTGTWSATFGGTTVPGAPTSPVASTVAGDSTKLSVAFTAPTGTATITGYQFSTNGGSTWSNATGSSSPITLTGLSGATAYTTLQIRAVNAGGSGTATASFSGTTLLAAPTSPVASGVSADGTKLSIAFTAPSGTVTSYQYSLDGGSNWTTAAQTSSPIVVTGLTANTAYTNVVIRAVNATGNGAATAVFSGTTVPGAPAITGVSGNTTSSFAVGFTAPSGVVAISGYEYSIDAGVNWVALTSSEATARSFTLSGLSSNQVYSIRLRATNTGGTGTYDTYAGTTVAGVVGSLTVSAVSGDSTHLAVSFTAPSGNAVVSSYSYSLDGTNWTSFTPTSANGVLSYTLTGLSANTSYTVRVAAVNFVGRGSDTSANATTALAAPTSITASGIDGDGTKLSVAFTNPGGAELITGYQYSLDSGTTWLTAAETSSPIHVTGLTAGTSYSGVRLRVVAGSTAGSYATFSGVTSGSAPTITAVTSPSHSSLSVAFTLPAATGAATNVEYSTDGGTTWTTRASASVASPLVIIGLSGNTSYDVQVRSVNAGGVGAASATSTGLTLADAPTTVTASSVDGSASTLSVSFTPPTGAGTITSYEVSVNGGTSWSTATGSGSPITITGLSGNTTFDALQIRAVNSAGKGASTASFSGTTVPGAVTAVSTAGVGGDGTSLTVTFTAPSGAGTITGYEYSLSADGAWVTAAETSSPITITGLDPNTEFDSLRIRSISAAGNGVVVATSGTTTPGAPTSPVASGVDGSATTLSVAFTAPGGTGTITGYDFSTDNGATWNTATGTSSPITLTGLSGNTTYETLKIRARTSGAGTASVSFAGTTVAAAPTALTLSGVDGDPTTLSVALTAPTGSESITGYEFSVDGGSTWSAATGTLSPITLTGLTANHAYAQLRVRAVTTAGKGASTSNLSGTTVPDAPTALTASAVSGDGTKLSVAFTAPVGSVTITGYEFSVDGGSTWSAATGSASPVVLGGFSENTDYTGVLLRAVSSAGKGIASTPFDGTTALGAPTSPLASPVAGDGTQLSVSFTAPGGTTTGYEFSVDGGTTWSAATGTSSPITLTGLTANHAYTQLALRATAANGAGSASTTFSGTTVPGVVSALTVSGVDGGGTSLSVSFSAPSGSVTITGYEYAVDDGSWVALTASETSARAFTIGALTADTAYSVAVRASNASGTGASASKSGVTVPGAPSAPVAVGVDGSSARLDVTFTVLTDGDSSITGYDYRIDDGSWTALSAGAISAGAFTATGLSSNTAHTVYVRATNAGGKGEASSSTGTTVPAAPTIGSVHSHTTTSFDVPFTEVSGAAAIVRYEYSVDGNETWTALSEAELSAGAATVVGLSANTVHSVRLRAVNASGNGVSATTSATTLAAAPIVSSTAGVAADGTKLTVSFTAPTGGGATITGYEFSTNGGSSWSSATGTASPITLTGLTANTNYSALRIRAVNAGGSGTASDEFAGATTAGPPTITGFSNVTTTSFDIAFTAPTGTAVTSYEYSIDGGTSWTAVAQTSSPISVSGRTANTNYTVVVRSLTNSVVGVASSSSVATTRPDAPTSLTASAVTASSTTLSVALTAPTGAATISGYEFSTNGGSIWSAATGTSSPITLTGLSANTLYSSITVRAVNAGGASAASASFTGTTVPGAPTAMVATAVTGDTAKLRVSFTAPTGGGVTISGYEYRLNGAASWTTATVLTATSVEISGMSANVTYAALQIRALNAAGTGVSSATFSGTTVTSAPTTPVASAVTGNSGSLSVAFTAPSGTITGYEFSVDGGSTWSSATGSTTPITLSGLTANTAYSALRVRAVTAAGSGASTSSFSGTTVPGAPSITSIVAASSTSLTVNFDAPTSPLSTSPASLTNYEFSIDGGTTWTPRNTTGTSSPITITGLTANTSYNVKIRAVNAGGSGVGSSTTTASTASVAPTVPVASGVTGDGSKLSIAFTAPAGTVTSYEFSTDAGSTWATATGTSSPITLTGLSGNTTYTTLRIRAVTAAGKGDSTTSFSGTTTPGAPTISSITGASTTSIKVNVTAPSGAVTISSYQISTDGGTTWAAGTLTSGAITVSSLTSNVDYNVQVRALSAAGTGTATASSVGAPLPGNPSSISTSMYSGDGTKLNVSFTPPTGTSALQYQYSLDNKSNWSTSTYSATVTSGVASMVIDGLTPNTSYSNFVLRAVNSYGVSSGTARLTTAVSAAAAPTALTLTGVSGDGTKLTAAYTAGASSNAITNYQWSLDGGTTWISPGAATGAVSTFVITGLTANTAYTNVKIRSVSAAGAGSASDVVSGTTTAGAPTSPVASAVAGTATSLSVSFTAPSGSATVVKYQYTTSTTWVDAVGTTSPITLTGLSGGTTYSALKIRVVTAAGNGAESAAFSGTTVPAAPTSLSESAATTTSASISFTAPTGTITSYEYSLDGTNWTTASQSASPITITGLTTNNTYDVYLRAVSAAGTGVATAAFATTTAPEAPSVGSVSGVAGDGTKLTVSFTQAQGARALASARAATITGYQYSTNGSTWVAATGTSSPITLTGLTANTKYSALQIRATNAGATSAASTSFAGTTVPGSPAITSISGATNSAFSVNFTAPSGAATISGYEVSTDGGTTWSSASGTSSPITVSGLTTNTVYAVQLRALNEGGTGAATGSTSGTTTAAAPTSVSVSAVVGDGTQATAAFTAPSGAATISGYSFSLDGGSTWAAATGSTSPITLTGLAGNTAYTQVQVRAVNAGGSGTASGSASVTTTPGLATSVTVSGVTGDTAKLSVAFTAPSGSVSITGYQYSTNGGTNWTTASETTSPVVITGLAANTAYSQVTLRAVNASGAGSKITNTTGTTVQAAPTLGALSSITTTGFSVAFTAAAAGGGATITTYQYSVDGGTTWATRAAGTTASPIVISGLSANNAYSLKVRAVNAGGSGVASSAITATTLPDVPTGMTATGVAGDPTKLSVSFTTPSGNATITGYEFTTATAYVAATGTSSPITLTGLTANTAYTALKIRAINAGGTGAATANFSGTTVLAAPTALSQSSATSSSVTVAFTKPTGTVAGMQYSVDGGLNWSTAAQSTTPITITGLVSNSTYDVQLRTVSAGGSGAASATMAATTVPGPPLSPSASPVDGDGTKLSVSFTAPTSASGVGVRSANITGYQYSTDGTNWTAATGTASPVTLPGLTANTKYTTVYLRATNSGGTGSASVAFEGQTTLGAPTITGITAPSTTSLSIAFTAAASGADTITNYQYSLNGGTTWITRDPASTTSPISVTGLAVETAYNVQVRVINPTGIGSASATTVGVTAPTAPTNLVVSPYSGDATKLSVAFTDPTPPSPHTLYEYRIDGGAWLTAVGTTSPVVVGGSLSPLTTYSVEIRAYNAGGVGDASSAASGTTGIDSPSITAVNTVSASSLSVEFTAPNAGTVTNYQYSVDGGTTWATRATGTTASPLVITGLASNTSFNVKLRALDGASVAGSASAATSGVTKPGLATITGVTSAAESTLSVAVTAPTGNATITNYEYSTDGGTNWTPRSPSSSTSPIVISGLAANTAYNVQVRAINAGGTGAATASTVGTTVPGAPVIVSIGTATAAGFTVTITPPGGTPAITAYQYSTDGGTTWTVASVASNAFAVASLASNTTYNVKVRASNASGYGTASATTVGTTLPGKPTISSFTGYDGDGTKATITITALTGNATITGYQYSLDNNVTYVPTVYSGTTSSGSVVIVVGGLTANTSNASFTIRAINAAGAGSGSTKKTVVTVPGQPTIGSVTGLTNSSVRVVFTAPSGVVTLTNYEYSIDGVNWTARSAAAITSPWDITGLSPNTAYDFRIRATNAGGKGEASAISSFTTIPAAPTAVTASGVAGDSTKLSVAFAKPAGTITSYQYSINGGASWTTASETTSPITLSGLTASTTYSSIQVRAIAAGGTGDATASVSGTTATAVPTLSTATLSETSGRITVTTAPSGTISGYQYSIDSGAWSSAASSPLAITGLSANTAYSVRVRAVNGSSIGGDAATVTITTFAAAPTISSISGVTSSSISVAFSAPGGTAALSNYEYSVDGGTNWAALVPPATASPFTVSSLAGNTTYSVKVRAVNAAGSGTASAASGVTTLPSAPTSPVATAVARDSSKLTISFVAPTGAVTIAGYEYRLDSSSAWTTATLATATSMRISGLPSDTTYASLQIRAVNATGAGDATATFSGTTVHAAPTINSVTHGNASVTVGYQAAPENPPADVTSFNVYAYTDTAGTLATGVTNPQVDTTVVGCTTTASSCEFTFTGLANGATYYFRAAAVTANGEGDISTYSSGASPATVPDAPQMTAPNSGNTTVEVHWNLPTFNGGATVLGYRVYTYTDSAGTTLATGITNPVTFTGAATNRGTLTGLTNLTSYYFRVVAYNVEGDSTPSGVSAAAVPLPVSDPPNTVTGAAGNQQVTVSWHTPTYAGVSPLTSYKVFTYSDANTEHQVGDVVVVSGSPLATSTVITGLTNGSSYWFEVVASNAEGDSMASTESEGVTPRTVPDTPTAVQLQAGIGKITLNWTAPQWNGGAAITAYRVYTYSDAGATTQVGSAVTVSSGTPFTTTAQVTGLTNGTDYWFRVEAVNEAGASVKTAADTDGIAPLAAPNAPTIGATTSGNTTITVNWTALTPTTARPVDGYLVYAYTDAAGSTLATGTTNPQTFTGAATSSGVVTGLTNGTRYWFRVSGYNEAAESTKSSVSATATPSTVSDAPTIGVVAAANTAVTVNWTVPVWNGGSAITTFKVYAYTDADGTTLATGTTNPQSFAGATTKSGSFTGLTNGTTYWFTVVAVNVKGDSNASALSGSATARTVPDAPSVSVTSRGDRELTFSLTEPTWNGGSAVTSYQYSTDGGTRWTTLTGSSPYTIVNQSGTTNRLVNGTSYNVIARAVNVAGSGAASTSSAGTPATVPGAPTAAVGTRGNEEMTVTWTAPASNGGDAISDYRVTVYATDGSSSATGVTGDAARLVGSDATSFTFTGLTNGTSYRFKVAAKNAMGWSTLSSASTAVMANAENPPLAMSVVRAAVGVSQDIDVTLTGTNLVANATVTSDAKVTISNVVAVDGSITFTMAGVTAGSSTLTVVNPDHGIGWATVTVTDPLADLAITSLPAGIAQGATRALRVGGTGIQDGATIVDASLPTGVTLTGSTAATTNGGITFSLVAASDATLGTHSISVLNPDGGTATFNISVNLPPTLTGLSPSAVGPGASSVPLVLTGTNFFVSSDVVLVPPTGTYTGTVHLDRAQYSSNTQANLVVSVSSDATYAKWTVRFINADGGIANITLTVMPALSVSSMVDPAHAEYTVDGALQLAKPLTSYTDYLAIKVSGVGIQKGATFSISGTGVLVGTPVYTFDEATGVGTLTAKVRVQSTAATGLRTITVINPDKATATLVNSLRIV